MAITQQKLNLSKMNLEIRVASYKYTESTYALCLSVEEGSLHVKLKNGRADGNKFSALHYCPEQ